METVALQFLGFDAPDIEDIKQNCRDERKSFSLEILLQWRDQSYENNSEVNTINRN